MNAIIIPEKGGLQLQDITHYNLKNSGSEQDFRALAELAAFTCNCPVAAISLAGIKHQWSYTKSNASSYQTPVHDMFHAAALLPNEVLIITDIENDKRFTGIQACESYDSILFYAGTPIVTSAGVIAGSVFVMDTSPRENFTRQQRKALKSIAKLVLRLLELNVANRFVIRQAEGLIEEEKKMARLVISEQEAEKGLIAQKLQESFAQTLAATKLYLEFAEQSSGHKDQFIHKGLENISAVIDEIKNLCHTMVPTTLGNANPIEFLEDMVAEWETKNNIYIDFICGANLNSIDGNIGLALFRIIQQQLRLAAYCNAAKAEITIMEKEGIVVFFSMKGMNFVDADPRKELFINNINARVAMINGQMTIDSSLVDNDVMVIGIPG